jgi:divalent metal cation (Fe/Co/Zn/Cd) transporter
LEESKEEKRRMDRFVAYGAGSGGFEPARLRAELWSGFVLFTDLHVAVNFGLVANETHRQPEKTKKAMCKKFTDRTKWTTRIF